MNYTKRTAITLTIIPLALAAGNSLFPRAHAQEVSLGIYPTTTEIEAKLGTVNEATLSIKNTGRDSVVLTPLLQPFTAAQSETGEVQYQDHIPEFFKYVQLSADGAVLKELSLAPGEEKVVILKVLVPREEKPQDYYFSLIMLSKPELPEFAGNEKHLQADSAISAGVASHILLSIEPQAIRDVKLTEFSSPVFIQQSRVSFRVRVTNESSNFTKLGGKVSVENFLGNTIETIEIPQSVVLARSTRLLSDGISKVDKSISPKQKNHIKVDHGMIQNDLFPGVYRATLTLTGDKLSYPINKTIYFFVAPIELLVTCVFVILVLYVVKKRIMQKYRSS